MTELFENWNRFYDPSIGRYLQPEPMMEMPNMMMFRLKVDETPLPAVYAYARNNPIANIDDDGNYDSQAKKDGWPDQRVRDLEKGLRKDLTDKCAKEADQNYDDCNKKNRDTCQKELPPKGQPVGIGDLLKYENDLAIGGASCKKGARCEFEACVAGANSGKSTTDYERAFTACMRRP